LSVRRDVVSQKFSAIVFSTHKFYPNFGQQFQSLTCKAAMKKIFAISLALFILLSGMHFSVAAHFCGGEVAELKWSFTGETPSCGIVESHEDCTAHDQIANNYCQNKLSMYSVDSQYKTSSFQIFQITQSLLNTALVPISTLAFSTIAICSVNEDSLQQDIGLDSKVDLTSICNFRI